jgi:recombination protein RecR
MIDAMRRLIDLLRQLPGVGEKTATRLTLHILALPADFGLALSEAVKELIERVKPCAVCGNLSEESPCAICRDPRRDATTICVVERIPDLLAVENTHDYRGLYHVLHGVLNPLEGTGPENLHIEDLLKRLPGKVKEIILATSSSVEGEATALYLKKRLAPFGLRVSRIASGIPVGGELEYVDRGTLGRALAGRRDI